MNERIAVYLESLDLPSPVSDRVLQVVRGFDALCSDGIERLFVCDTLDPSTGERGYESLWGFHKGYWMEARKFLLKLDIDISTYANSILYLGAEYENLDLSAAATAESRLVLEIETAKVRYSTLSATGLNCNELIAIMNELLLPALKDSAGGGASLTGA